MVDCCYDNAMKEANRKRSEATKTQHEVSNPRIGESSGPVPQDTAPKTYCQRAR